MWRGSTRASQDSPPQVSNDPLALWRRVGRALLAIPAAIWLFVEEWLWDGMLAFMRWLRRLPPVAWAEKHIAKLPPYAAMVAFLIPAAVLLPFKFFAFWLIAKGQAALGAIVFVIAKVIGTAFLARIFSLTKPALLTINWFRRGYEFFVVWKTWLYGYMRALPLYVWMRTRMREMRAELRLLWQRAKN
jgi:hypothetical protein